MRYNNVVCTWIPLAISILSIFLAGVYLGYSMGVHDLSSLTVRNEYAFSGIPVPAWEVFVRWYLAQAVLSIGFLGLFRYSNFSRLATLSMIIAIYPAYELIAVKQKMILNDAGNIWMANSTIYYDYFSVLAMMAVVALMIIGHIEDSFQKESRSD